MKPLAKMKVFTLTRSQAGIFMLKETKHEFYRAHKYVKILAIFGILKYVSRINTISEISKQEKLFYQNLSFYQQLKFYANLR